MSTFVSYVVLLQVVTFIPAALFVRRTHFQSSTLNNTFFILAVAFVVVGTFIWLSIGLSPLILIPIVFAVLFLFLKVTSQKAMIFVAASALAIDLSYLIAWSVVLREVNERLRRHPTISLVDRLEYERDVRGITNFEPLIGLVHQSIDESSVKNVPVAPNVDLVNVRRFEGRFAAANKNAKARQRFGVLYSLKRAHLGTESQFVNELGLGVSRMRSITSSEWQLDLPAVPSFPQRTSEICLADVNGELPEADFEFRPWHEENIVNFANPITLGIVFRDGELDRPRLDHVLGFQSHGFRTPPNPLTEERNDVAWRIESLALVSLLKHHPPSVYLSDHLPNMEVLVSVPARPLDDFESTAVERLTAGQDLVVRGNESRIRMVGSIRAAVQCLECHQVPRGTLLGAFTYQLSPEK